MRRALARSTSVLRHTSAAFWHDAIVSEGQQKTSAWDIPIDRGFSVMSVNDYEQTAFDDVWRPHRRGTTLQFLIVPLGVGVLGGLVGVFSGDSWVDAVTGGLGFGALLVLVWFGPVAAWNLRYIGARSVIFTDNWVGIQRRNDIAFVRYDAIRSMWFEGWKRPGALQIAVPSGRIHVTRTDGMPFTLPRVLTYTKRDREDFLAFTHTQATKRALAIQDA